MVTVGNSNQNEDLQLYKSQDWPYKFFAITDLHHTS
jgi:hypothetical protein